MNSYILLNENALFYECNFSCDNAIFLRVDENNSYFVTDSRYILEASECIKNAKVVDGDRELVKEISKIINDHNLKELIYDPKEWSVDKFELLKNYTKTILIPKIDLSHQKREIKSEDEIEIIKEAAIEGKKAFDRFCDFIRSDGIGLSEEELFFNAELILKDKGKLGLSFSPIVAINENAAKPHALPTKKILKNGDLLLVDAGIIYKRYCSDRTRTVEVNRDFNFSKEQSFSSKKMQKIYDTVLLANKEAIKAIKPNVKASYIDKVAREVIKDAGYEKFFIHSTGHGVGLDIHELPYISQNSDTILKEGMVFTVEPGIYLPNEFGVRIEDMVLVTKNGAHIL